MKSLEGILASLRGIQACVTKAYDDVDQLQVIDCNLSILIADIETVATATQPLSIPPDTQSQAMQSLAAIFRQMQSTLDTNEEGFMVMASKTVGAATFVRFVYDGLSDDSWWESCVLLHLRQIVVSVGSIDVTVISAGEFWSGVCGIPAIPTDWITSVANVKGIWDNLPIYIIRKNGEVAYMVLHPEHVENILKDAPELACLFQATIS